MRSNVGSLLLLAVASCYAPTPPVPPPDYSLKPKPPKPPLPDWVVAPVEECQGLSLYALPAPISLPMPGGAMEGKTDGAGNLALAGYLKTAFGSAWAYRIYAPKDGGWSALGNHAFGGNDDGDSQIVYAEPSGFTSIFRNTDFPNCRLQAYTHDGAAANSTMISPGYVLDEYNYSAFAHDPLGGTAVIRSYLQSSASWVVTYQHVDSNGAASTSQVAIGAAPYEPPDHEGFIPVGVAINQARHVLVLMQKYAPYSVGSWTRGRWLDQSGAPLTDWFDIDRAVGVPEPTYVKFDQLVDGTLAIRGNPYNPDTDTYVATATDLSTTFNLRVPDWLKTVSARSNWQLAIIRNGAGYATWSDEENCLRLLNNAGASCGCKFLPGLSSRSQRGEDGSLVVINWDGSPDVAPDNLVQVYPQLLK